MLEEEYPASWDEVKAPTKRPAAQRHAQYKVRRAALIERMGGLCLDCGTCLDLEFEHPQGRDWVARKLGRMQRIKKYEEDFLKGLLTLLCRTCNARKAGFDTQRKLRERKRQ